MSFAQLGLSDAFIRVVTELGYNTPTQIQQEAIPAVLAEHDLLASAQTGTGKTAAFALPILQQLLTRRAVHDEKRPYPPIRSLILTPTRELAIQVQESVEAYSKYVKLSSTVVYGGVNMRPQITRLKRRVDVLVATPGRLLDHVQQKTVDLSHVEILVLDEADRMLDMGFIHDIRRIMALLPAKRQNLLFSATFSDPIKTLADSLLDNPKVIEVERQNTTAQTIKQTVYQVDRDRKRELLTHLIHRQKWDQALIFTRTKHGANRLSEQLENDGIRATAIHGDKSQAARIQALTRFKKGQVRILVATDVAARGIDIDELPYVVNYDLPMVAEDYIHRIGRTGRAGAEGEAISLVCTDERHLLKDIERLIKRPLDKEIIDGFEPNPDIRPEPVRKGRAGDNGKVRARRSYDNTSSKTRQGGRTDSPFGQGAHRPGASSDMPRRPDSGSARRTAKEAPHSAAKNQEHYHARAMQSYGQFSDQVAAGEPGSRAAGRGKAENNPRAYGKKAQTRTQTSSGSHTRNTGQARTGQGQRPARRNANRTY